MRALLRQGLAKLDARPKRERLLCMGVAMVLVYLLLDTLLISPEFERYQAANKSAREAEQSVRQAQESLTQSQRKAFDDKAAQEHEMAVLSARIAQSQQQLAARRASLVPAPDMLKVLDGVLRLNAGLKLQSMQNLAPAELGVVAGGTPLYRHGVQLTVEGSYAELLAYCRELEGLPQHLLWGPMAVDAKAYPRVRLHLQLYTLSQEKPWLQL